MKIKSIIVLASLFGLLQSCGGNGAESKSDGERSAAEFKNDPTSNPDYKKGLALIGKSDCLTCHKVNEASTGPAYAAVAAKYADADEATITRLGQTIIKGGSGNWGTIPMTPHPSLSQEDAEQMVKYVLLLKK